MSCARVRSMCYRMGGRLGRPAMPQRDMRDMCTLHGHGRMHLRNTHRACALAMRACGGLSERSRADRCDP
eukprot:2972371-Pyramimonas_sp.AAC.1